MHLIYDLPGDVQGVIFKKVFEMEVLEQLKLVHSFFKAYKLDDYKVPTLSFVPRRFFKYHKYDFKPRFTSQN